MSYFKLIFNKQKIISVIIVLQLAAVIAMTMMMFSAYRNRVIYYRHFEEPLSQSGICLRAMSGDEYFATEESILQVFTRATKVTGGKAIELVDADNNDIQPSITIYPDDIMDSMPPMLLEGEYPKENDEFIECLVSMNSGYDIGDEITYIDYSDNSTYKIKITGVAMDNQLIYGTGGSAYYHYYNDYRDFYYVMNSAHRDGPLLITTESLASSQSLEGYYNNNSILIIEVPPEERYTMDEIGELAYEYDFTYMGDVETYRENSELYVNEQLMILVPIAIAIFVITLFTVITTGIIGTYNNIYNYAVLYLCGNTWRKCAMLNMIKYLVIAAAAIVIDVLFFAVGSKTYLKETVISIGIESVIISIALFAIILVMSIIIPLIVVSRKQPRDVLKTQFSD